MRRGGMGMYWWSLILYKILGPLNNLNPFIYGSQIQFKCFLKWTLVNPTIQSIKSSSNTWDQWFLKLSSVNPTIQSIRIRSNPWDHWLSSGFPVFGPFRLVIKWVPLWGGHLVQWIAILCVCETIWCKSFLVFRCIPLLGPPSPIYMDHI